MSSTSLKLAAALTGGAGAWLASQDNFKMGAAALGLATTIGGYLWLKGHDSGAPDYTNGAAWFRQEQDASKEADCFYAHPTTEVSMLNWNVAWDGYGSGTTCTGLIAGDPDLCVGHAGAFAGCNIWAPRYRQMGFLSQAWVSLPTASSLELAKVQASLQKAYSDLKAAFLLFLEQRPDKSKPFVIAGHSQGAVLMTRVIRDCVDGTEHMKSFVAAYLCGGYVPQDLFGESGVFKQVTPCQGPDQLGCIISYDTRVKDLFKPEMLNNMGLGFGLWPHHLYWLLFDKYCSRPEGTDDVAKARLQVNPLTWSRKAGGVHLGVYKRSGSEPPLAPLLPPAGWADGVEVTDVAVMVPNPDEWLKGASHAGGPGNMHPIDVQFWFYNIQANVSERLEAWKKAAK